jgi:arylformamidase
MTLIDISVPLRAGTPEWPGDTPFSCQWTWERARGDSVNVSATTASPHVGTHADAPVHVADGLGGAETLPLDAFFGTARVIMLRPGLRIVELADLGLEGEAPAAERLLLRTGCGIASGRFPEDWPALSESCARALVVRGLRLLGVDAPSVDARESRDLTIHHVLFEAGACILENLDLAAVQPGDYELLAAPIRLVGLDAAPVRAVLRPLPSA